MGGIQVGNQQTVPQGEQTFIDYAIYDSPVCAAADFTNDHLYNACYWASGGTEVTKDDIPALIQANCWLNFTAETWVDPWSLGTQAGDCRVHSGLMEAALEVLGVPADGIASDEDTTYMVKDESTTNPRWCDTHGRYEWHMFQEVTLSGGGGSVTNFEAVCKVYLSDEATPYDCYYDKAMGSPYQAGTHDDMWTEWNSNPPPNHKIIDYYVGWQNHY